LGTNSKDYLTGKEVDMAARKGSCRPGAKPRVGKPGDKKPRGGRGRRSK